MSWIDDHKGVWRVAVLVLLLAAIIGPWTFDRIYVPSQYQCSAPFVRLQGDFCGMPLPGMRVFSWVVVGFIYLVAGLVTGATVLTDFASEFPFYLFLGALIFLLVLPFFSTLLLILRGGRQHWQAYHLAVWVLAAGASLLLAISGFSRLHRTLWGIWLYIGLAACALILEGLTLAAGRRASSSGEL